MERRIVAIRLDLFCEHEAKRVPYADVCSGARTSCLFYLFDDGAASLLVGEHGESSSGCELFQPARELGALRNDRGVALGPGRDHTDFHLQEIAAKAPLIHRGLGQSSILSQAVARLAPARQPLAFPFATPLLLFTLPPTSHSPPFP